MFFIFINVYLIPILGIIFCLNLVEIIKKIKNDQPTAANTFWLTSSFILIIWSIAFAASMGA
ncbi:hypothetical protein [Bacillus sp. CGMCC 1.16541]|uniref:hypothetical protein n=1 Tax=Bacillus sp. CGMCC 1.16541 TaxID=2185143 RepID=UPI000D7380B4|nr:hypothetical protein [Bacillus sp. CGMCC 1.16541]